MGKPTAIVTRPAAWGKLPSDKVDITFAPIGGANPKLRNGRSTIDDMGVVATRKGVELLVRLMDKIKPDVFLFWPHFGEMNKSVFARLRKVAPNTIFVHGSGNQVLEPHGVCWYVHEYLKYIDVVATNTRDRARFDLLLKWVPRVETLYTFGFDPALFTLPVMAPVHDCFFGGGDSCKPGKPQGRFPRSRFRHDLMVQISKRWDLLIRGGGTWPMPYKKGLQGLDYFREMQRAKIILGTYHDDLERRYTKRTIYGGASGRLFITRKIKGMQKDFTNHKNIVWFETIKEGLRLIDFYLNNDEKREEVARQQRCHFVRNHSWKARLHDFENLVGRLT